MGSLVLTIAMVLAASRLGDVPQAKEELLRNARVVSKVDVGTGVTGAQKVELESKGRRLKAIFKTVDKRLEAEWSYGREKATLFRDSWKHEVAAYELDQLLCLGLVPVAVEREIGGRRGSLQVWVSLERPGFGHPPPERRLADDDVQAIRLLDYLVFNTDRHFRNLFFGKDWQPVAIDHSLAFHPMKIPYRPLHRFPRQPVARLRVLDRQALEKALGRYLEKDQLDALDARRKLVLEHVDALVRERSEGAVLYHWPFGKDRCAEPESED